MWKCLFNVAAAVSFVVCVVTAGLWARSLGHFEQVSLTRVSKPHSNEAHLNSFHVTWYSNTIRLHIYHKPLPASWVEKHGEDAEEGTERARYRTGWEYAYAGDDTTLYWSYSVPGFGFRHLARADGIWSLTLSVRPWLPTLLASVLPLAWYFRFRRANRSSRLWQFSLREMLVMVTVSAVLFGVAIWLKN